VTEKMALERKNAKQKIRAKKGCPRESSEVKNAWGRIVKKKKST